MNDKLLTEKVRKAVARAAERGMPAPEIFIQVREAIEAELGNPRARPAPTKPVRWYPPMVRRGG
jgi:hypothetical protein